jgi:hypothetical protein
MIRNKKYYVKFLIGSTLCKEEIVLTTDIPLSKRKTYITENIVNYYKSITKGLEVKIVSFRYIGTVVRI